jgi:hypothetical protein
MEILNITYKNPRPFKFKGKFQEAETFTKNRPYHYPKEAEESEKRWAAKGLLDNIKDPFVRQVISMALDNQEKYKPGRSNKAQSCRTIKWKHK